MRGGRHQPNHGVFVGEDPLNWTQEPTEDTETFYDSTEAGASVAPELVVEFSVTACPANSYTAAQVTSEDSVY
ncbi:hypothetical protein DVA67_018670 [Solirubrobacter sp. CPCC 204708]|uniref:Uncharacterized protein n=1 Tax=Solirubrobacter deserti TaxID=2282478 RepID=A0ABT4RM95_9ACTN|nr:hypothetical protein [Solirubrobacter deserti]MBE2318012.1 hypothetical protein [Solirubrobacter deserti]MDA0139691.1 hypothetical protein [Solirubrobacter deserti]